MAFTRWSLLLLLCAAPLLIASAFPNYLQKCKDDATLNDCFLKKAQAGYPYIITGDKSLGIPSYIPLIVPSKQSLGTDLLTFDIENLEVSNLESISVAEAKWNTANKTIYLKFVFNDAVIYNFDVKLEGTFLDQHLSFNGHCRQDFINGNVTIHMEYEEVLVNDVSYSTIKREILHYNVEKTIYTFENNDDLNKFIKNHWKEFQDALRPQLEPFVGNLASIPFEAIMKATPMSELFD